MSPHTLPFLREAIKTQNQAFKDVRPVKESALTWASAVYRDYEDLLNSPSLSPFKNLDIAHLGVTESFKECDTVGCTDYGASVVRINRDATASIFAKQPQEAARKTMKAVLGHELGHFIFDFYLLKGKGYASLEEAQQSMGALKYHLTVDAVGMELGTHSASEFADILKVSLKSEVFGEPRFVGDSGERFLCLTKLN